MHSFLLGRTNRAMDAPASILRPTAGQRALAEALAGGEGAMGTKITELKASD